MRSKKFFLPVRILLMPVLAIACGGGDSGEVEDAAPAETMEAATISHADDAAEGSTLLTSNDASAEDLAAVAGMTGDAVAALTGARSFANESSETFRAGFDCTKATTSTEKAICSNALLAANDKEMNEVYVGLLEKFAITEDQTLRSTQRSWMQRRDRDCSPDERVDESCLFRMYSERIKILSEMKLEYKKPDFVNRHLGFGFQELPENSNLSYLKNAPDLIEGKEFSFLITVDGIQAIYVFVGFWSGLTDQGIDGGGYNKLGGVSYYSEESISRWDNKKNVRGYSMERPVIFRNYFFEVPPEHIDWFEDNLRFY